MAIGRDSRWIIAFDSSCGSCRRIAASVERACGEKLEVLPLAHPDVERLRAQFWSEPPWAPTLLRVENGVARCWVGRAMALPMALTLGVRSTMNVLGALGELRQQQVEQSSEVGMSRKLFMRLGAGAVVAGGMVLTGNLPAYAGPSPAALWVEENRGKLPQTYDDLIAHPMEFRRAIYRELNPAVRSDMWVEHVERYKAAHVDLTARQNEALDAVLRIFRDSGNFKAGAAPGKIMDVTEQIKASFGLESANQIVATLGPVDVVSDKAVDCQCATSADLCTNNTNCAAGTGCNVKPGGSSMGCGPGWFWDCDGLCMN